MATKKKRKSPARKAPKAKAPRRKRRSSKAGKVDFSTIITLVVGAFLAIFASPMIAKKFPTFSKYSGPLLAGVGILLASKAKGRTRMAGVGLTVGGSVLALQSYQVDSTVKKVINGPSRMPINGPSNVINGPSKPYGGRQITNAGSSLASQAPAI